MQSYHAYEWLPEGIELLASTEAADWVVSRLRPWDKDGVRVGSFMPDAFEAYARVLHPAGERGPTRGLPWSEVASRLSMELRPKMQFWDIVGRRDLYAHPVLGDVQPLSGSLPPRVLKEAVGFLSHWTGDEPCWFAMWEGWGTWWKGAHGVISRPGSSEIDPEMQRIDEERDRVLRSTPRVRAYARNYFLMRGDLPKVLPLFEAAGWQSPSLWWPDGRHWLVSTEVDAFSSYVGGSNELIGELLEHDEIEAVPARLDARLDEGL